jgi:hypothetical protein
MEMVGDLRPCVARGFAFTHHPGQSIQKIITINVIDEYLPALYPRQMTGRNAPDAPNAGFSWHALNYILFILEVKRIL